MRIRDWDRNLKIRLFGESLMNITFWMFFPFLTIYFTEAFGKSTAGILLIFSQVLSVAANLLGGTAADRFGRKRMMVLSAAGQGLAYIVFAFVNSPWIDMPIIAFACFTFAGMCGSIYYPASEAMIADIVDEKNRSSVFAVFYTSLNLSVVVGPILGSIFFNLYRFPLLLIGGLLCVLLSIILSLLSRETKPLNQQGNKAKVKTSYKFIFKDKVFFLYLIASILISQIFMQLDFLLPIFTKDNIPTASILLGQLHITLTGQQTFGFILSENGLIVALLTVVITRWMGTWKEKHVFFLSSLVYSVSFVLFSAFQSVWGAIIAMAVFSLAELMAVGVQQSFVARIAPSDQRGQYFAASSLRYTIGKTLAPMFIPLTQWIGYATTFYVLSFIGILSAFLYIGVFAMRNKLQMKRR